MIESLLKRKIAFCLIGYLLLTASALWAQPTNDNCSNASVITIPNGGFGVGKFTSTTDDITQATLQTGETFAPAILVAGQNRKSMWYKFTIPTTRVIRVTLAQPGTGITAGDAGFAVYKVNTCLPKVEDISSKLTPIGTFGNTFHPCVDSGMYYVQVSANNKANGPLYIEVQISDSTGALYDHPKDAYDFGVLNTPNAAVSYPIGCHSIEDATEICASFPDALKYHKTSWHTFTTPAYFDYISLLLTNAVGKYYVSWITYLKFGYRIYKGDAKTTPIASLVPLGSCDSLMTNGQNAGFKMYKCNDLEPNTTYSIQIFAREDFFNDIRLTMSVAGSNPTQSPTPVLTPSNDFGTIVSTPRATNYTLTDYLACNSRFTASSCSPALPPTSIDFGGVNYNLSTFFTFTLTEPSNIQFLASSIAPTACGPRLAFRLFQKKLTANCADFDTANLMGTYTGYYQELDCLWPGTYTVQVLGTDATARESDFSYSSTFYGARCRASNLGSKISLQLEVTRRVGMNKFSLSTPGAFDSINNVGGVMMPLENRKLYRAKADTFGCIDTVLPPDTTCSPQNTKVMYRQFTVADSGVVELGYMQPWMQYKLYLGDANSLAAAQNAHTYPTRISGLIPQTECMEYDWYCNNYNTVCVVPGTYTFTTFSDEAKIGSLDQPSVTFSPLVTRHYSASTAQDMGSILDSIPSSGGSFRSDIDTFSCKDNAVVINGYVPCTINKKPATKAIYRQFYLKESAMVTIKNIVTHGYSCNDAPPVRTLFYGKATDGLSGLTPVGGRWECFANSNYKDCDLLPVGWYTVVSYGSGPTYDEPMKSLNEGRKYGSYVNKVDYFSIDVTVCPSPKYNRPYKASVNTAGQPHLIDYTDRAASSPAYPITDTSYNLPGENFNCIDDTPFNLHPIVACDTTVTKVAYWVFRTTRETYMEISTGGLWGTVYALDVRKDSALFPTATPIQPCVKGFTKIQLCRLPAGTYTLVIFAGSSSVCSGVTPSIYVDQVRDSRFDHANKAYDFDIVPPDSSWHYGKVGDVNPLHPNRPASNDFFACTAGSQPTDPTNPVCSQDNIYNMYDPSNFYMYEGVKGGTNIVRRNLWYTFVVNQPGRVYVKVDSKTKGKARPHIFAVYQSNVDGSIPFSQVVSSGQVDSSVAQGLTFVATNRTGHYCNANPNGTNFYRDPCTQFLPQRYYILIEENNPTPYDWGTMMPNNQVEVGIMVDSINIVPTKYDHYYQAYDFGSVGAGKHVGGTDNFSCATRDATDPFVPYSANGCSKTLWYKFTSTMTGNVRYHIKVGNTVKYARDNIQLFYEASPGDSTSKGLIYQAGTRVTGTDGTDYAQNCVFPGTWYLVLPGCDQINEFVFPEIELVEQEGDFCSRPVVAPINGAGSSVSSVVITCHTIGTDYGEFNPELSCPPGSKTSEYKSSWFRIDITGTDTLDVTTYLSENTNVDPAMIKYRMMTGDCGAMQEESCVMDSRTRNTYKCLTAGSYYIQVFTPAFTDPRYPTNPVTGDISLNLSAVAHVDTCAPIKDCFANANFIPQFDCTTDQAVRFANYSTYGSSIKYEWDFGYNGQTSSAVSPAFDYPILDVDKTYQVTLKTLNSSCNDSGIVIIPVTIPARPKLNLSPDTTFCKPTSYVTIDAGINTWPGTTFRWNSGQITPTLSIYANGETPHWVTATYNGCKITDTIQVNKNSIQPKTQTVVMCDVDSVILNSKRNQQESHLWNTGSTAPSIYAYTGGIYTNAIDWHGCINVDTFKVIKPGAALGNDTSLCFNQPFLLDVTTSAATYTWQDNSKSSTFSATGPGQYSVTIKIGTCTITDTITLSGNVPEIKKVIASICSNQNYTLPSGLIVNKAGIYKDTIRYITGCDSLITQTTLSINSVSKKIVDTSICDGQNYQLPSGKIVTTTGFYNDTLRSASGCDSLVTSLNLKVNSVIKNSLSASICSGENYTLPSGRIVTTTGIFNDTLRYQSGCDSLITTADISLKTVSKINQSATICNGNNYTLPSGKIVNTTGIYSDTLRYTNGCDSLITQINLRVVTLTEIVSNETICAGLSFTMPWGEVTNTSGTYTNIIKSTGGCDSIKNTVNVLVKNVISQSISHTICGGENLTLPSGNIVSQPGIYYDIIRYASGCDSLITTANITLNSVSIVNQNVTICSGDSFTLISGRAVNTTGIYSDTLSYSSGCDSLISNINLTVKTVTNIESNVTICEGKLYALPWGQVVNTSGVYVNIIKSIGGCDSIKNTVNVSIKNVTNNNINTSICAGTSYTLPSGAVIFTPGIYLDTIRYISGCDSLISKVTILINSVKRDNIIKTICAGTTYTLPTGISVSTSGIYNDTLRFSTGCDSLITTVTLSVKHITTRFSNASICQGQFYTLPSGQVINKAGTYSDTLRYVSGCDSVITILNLKVVLLTEDFINPSICIGKTFKMPSGAVANATGNYTDIIKSFSGCDSVITHVSLTINNNPVVHLRKSNDISCNVGSATLSASGGNRYQWTPAESLSNPTVINPVATPLETTWYKVRVISNQNCFTEDSIQLVVNKGDASNSYFLPNAFTPNRDGLNDCFGVKNWGAVSNFKLTIYNRFGNIVFNTTDPKKCWDGVYKGAAVDIGAYIYHLNATTICGDIYRKGTVMVLR